MHFKESFCLDCVDETSCQMCAKYAISTTSIITGGCLQTLKCMSSLKKGSCDEMSLLLLKVSAQYVVQLFLELGVQLSILFFFKACFTYLFGAVHNSIKFG